MMKYKCYKCLIIIDEDDLVNGNCPECNGRVMLKKMCELDHCHCPHDVVETIAYCPKCGEAMCPECGCHDVAQISRVTGYLQEISGYNAGKQQEVKDRVRHDPLTGNIDKSTMQKISLHHN